MHPYLLEALSRQHRQELYRSARSAAHRVNRPIRRSSGC